MKNIGQSDVVIISWADLCERVYEGIRMEVRVK